VSDYQKEKYKINKNKYKINKINPYKINKINPYKINKINPYKINKINPYKINKNIENKNRWLTKQDLIKRKNILLLIKGNKMRAKLWTRSEWLSKRKIFFKKNKRALSFLKKNKYLVKVKTKVKLKKRTLIKLLNLISKSSDKKLIEIFVKKIEKKKKYIKALMWFEYKKNKFFNIAIRKLLNFQPHFRNFRNDKANLSRFICTNSYGLIFKKFAYEMYKKFLKKQGKKYKILAYTSKKNKKIGFVKLGIQKKIKKIKSKFRKKKFIYRKDKSKIWNSLIYKNPLLFIKKKLRKKAKVPKKRKRLFFRKLLLKLIKRRKYLKKKQNKLIKKSKAYWLKNQKKYKYKDKAAIYSKRNKRRFLKKKLMKKRKIELFLISKKEIIIKVKKKPSFYTWILTSLLKEWEWNKFKMNLKTSKLRNKMLKQRMRKRLKWLKYKHIEGKKKKILSKLKKVKITLKWIKKEPSNLFIRLFLKRKKKKKFDKKKVKNYYNNFKSKSKNIVGKVKKGFLKQKHKKIVNVNSNKGNKMDENVKLLSFNKILRKKKKRKVSKSRMYPSSLWRVGSN
jgi:hypothetical protein